jgi:hypothetical protein
MTHLRRPFSFVFINFPDNGFRKLLERSLEQLSTLIFIVEEQLGNFLLPAKANSHHSHDMHRAQAMKYTIISHKTNVTADHQTLQNKLTVMQTLLFIDTT